MTSALSVRAGQPAAQFVDAGRQDEHATTSVSAFWIELLGALPVDVEQEVVPFLAARLDLRLGRAVAVAEHVRPFEEIVRPRPSGRTRRRRRSDSRRRRSRPGRIGRVVTETDSVISRVVLQQHARDRRLARARGRGQDEHQPAAVERVDGCGSSEPCALMAQARPGKSSAAIAASRPRLPARAASLSPSARPRACRGCGRRASWPSMPPPTRIAPGTERVAIRASAVLTSVCAERCGP